jgi:ATP-binding cassette, subfamily B, bacterial
VNGTGDEEGSSAFRLLLRLRPWFRPHRRAMVAMILCASGAMLAQSLVPLVIGAVVDGPIRHHDTSGLWMLSGVALLFGLAEAVLFWARRIAMSKASLGIEADLRRDMFAHIQRLPVAFHDRWPSGQLLSRMTSDLSTLRRFTGFGFVFLIANSGTALVVVALLIHIHLWLGLFVVLAMTPLIITVRRFELRYSAQARHAQDLTGDLATSVEESVLGIRVIKSYGRRPHMLRGFTRDAQRLRGAELKKITTLGWFWSLLEGYPQLVLAGVTWGGVDAVAHGSMTLGELVAFLTLYLRLIWPIVSLGWLLAVAEEAATASERIFEVLDEQPTVLEPAAPVAAEQGTSLVFEDVHFHYGGTSDEDVAEAIEVAQAQFAYDLPFGLDTRIGEQGLSLSGGQRQRLALARAVLGRPRVLVLDDPLSALDVHTEAQVEAALRRVLAATTALVVAHRPSTVLLADRVALLQDGRIAAVGTHRELLQTVPAYRDLLAQTSELAGAS